MSVLICNFLSKLLFSWNKQLCLVLLMSLFCTSVRNAFLKIIEYGNSDGWNHSETVLLLIWHRINAKMLAVWLTGPLKKKDMQDFNNFSHNYARKLIDATLFSYRDIQRECAILLRHNAETLHFSIKKQIDWRFLNIIY